MKDIKVRSFKLGKVSGRKSFELGNKALLKTQPKGSLIGEGNIKVKIFQDGKGSVKIHMPKGGKLQMTKGRFMASRRDMKKVISGKKK